MTGEVVITAAAVVDESGVRGSAGTRATWRETGLDPVAGRVRWKPIFGTSLVEFRRLDITSRMFLIAAEACGIETQVAAEHRETTALVLATSTGCLAADQRFEKSLHIDKGIEPAVFPYTLPSTCLGELAIRYRLRGPSICLSIEAGDERQGLDVASALLRTSEASLAVVLLGDWAPPDKTAATALLLQRADRDTPWLARPEALGADAVQSIRRLLSHQRPPPGRRFGDSGRGTTERPVINPGRLRPSGSSHQTRPGCAADFQLHQGAWGLKKGT